jgi:hypothetical protein
MCSSTRKGWSSKPNTFRGEMCGDEEWDLAPIRHDGCRLKQSGVAISQISDFLGKKKRKVNKKKEQTHTSSSLFTKGANYFLASRSDSNNYSETLVRRIARTFLNLDGFKAQGISGQSSIQKKYKSSKSLDDEENISIHLLLSRCCIKKIKP